MQLRRNEILTGLLVLGTVVILTGILILLGAPGLFRPLVTYKIYFDNAAGIKLGAPVLLAGRKIGQVQALYSPVTTDEARRAATAANAPTPAPSPEASATPTPPATARYQVRIEIQVDKSAEVYKNSKARLITLGLLGETAIDFSQGSEAAGLAQEGEIFSGDRVPDFGEAIAAIVTVMQPLAVSANGALNQLQSTAKNLSKITEESSPLNMALAQFRTVAENMTNMTARDSSLSVSLKNAEKISNELTANDNLKVMLQNFRASSETLKSTLDQLSPNLQEIGQNVSDLTGTLRTQPWRLIYPTTKKYPNDQPPNDGTITIRKTTRKKAKRPSR